MNIDASRLSSGPEQDVAAGDVVVQQVELVLPDGESFESEAGRVLGFNRTLQLVLL